jgi:hypothetical protein
VLAASGLIASARILTTLFPGNLAVQAVSLSGLSGAEAVLGALATEKTARAIRLVNADATKFQQEGEKRV